MTILDGFDLLMFGAVLPILLESRVWGITPAQAGFVGSLSLVGMMFGAMIAGYVTDLVGRRPVVLGCIALFSIFTALCAVAPSVGVFGACRLLAGLGFGGALPTCLALTMEYVADSRRQFFAGLIQTGVQIGGVSVSIIAIFVIPRFGWEALFAVGGATGLVLLGFAYRNLPESIEFLESRARRMNLSGSPAQSHRQAISVDASAPDGRTRSQTETIFKALFEPAFRRATLIFPIIAFCGLLLSYGMNTWLPQILRTAGYDLGSALVFLVAFNLGAGVGCLVFTGLADIFGPRRVLTVGFVIGAILIASLTFEPPQAAVLALVTLIGFCVAAQAGVSAFVGVYYPPERRGTAIGLVVGIGRLGGVVGPIMVGLIASAGAPATTSFYAFAFVALAAAGLLCLIPRNEGCCSSTDAR